MRKFANSKVIAMMTIAIYLRAADALEAIDRDLLGGRIPGECYISLLIMLFAIINSSPLGRFDYYGWAEKLAERYLGITPLKKYDRIKKVKAR